MFFHWIHMGSRFIKAYIWIRIKESWSRTLLSSNIKSANYTYLPYLFCFLFAVASVHDGSALWATYCRVQGWWWGQLFSLWSQVLPPPPPPPIKGGPIETTSRTVTTIWGPLQVNLFRWRHFALVSILVHVVGVWPLLKNPTSRCICVTCQPGSRRLSSGLGRSDVVAKRQKIRPNNFKKG